MHRTADPRSEIEELNRVVNQALKQTKSGLPVNLTDLETHTTRICEHLLTLPPPEAHPYAAILERLIGGINALEEAITTSFGTLASEVGPHRPVMLRAK